MPCAAPQIAAVMERYLQRLGAFLAPASVAAAEDALRQLGRWMITDAGLGSIAAVRRDDIEDYKVWLADQRRTGPHMSCRVSPVVPRLLERPGRRAAGPAVHRSHAWNWGTSGGGRGETLAWTRAG